MVYPSQWDWGYIWHVSFVRFLYYKVFIFLNLYNYPILEVQENVVHNTTYFRQIWYVCLIMSHGYIPKNHWLLKIKYFFQCWNIEASFQTIPSKEHSADTAIAMVLERLWEMSNLWSWGWLVDGFVVCMVFCFVCFVCAFSFLFQPLTETVLYQLSGDLPGKQKEAVSRTSPGI